ncbi:MAG: hypothetical protein FWH44_00465 [Methanomassiliicoccaceae archaeon]|nr:hypothetical protein [Methanomassiliicoccaceae archaeon]
MSLLKKMCVLAIVAVALLIPAVAISENASGDAMLYDGSVRQTGGFDDRTNGTISVRVSNSDTSVPVTVNVTIRDPVSGAVYISGRAVTVPAGYDSRDFGFSFRIGSPGTYHLIVEISGDDAAEVEFAQSIDIEVGRSIWSNTWTYIAIVIVIIVILIAVFLKMRGAPKADSAGAFTAMEEERKADRKKTGTDREEYKGRSKK